MAYYEVVILLVFAIVASVSITFLFAAKNKQDEYKRGWNDSKQLYYTDVKKEQLREYKRQKAEEQKERDALGLENADFNPISADLLMAYGVSSIGQLPKSVKEAYNIDDKYNNIDLDSLILQEQE